MTSRTGNNVANQKETHGFLIQFITCLSSVFNSLKIGSIDGFFHSYLIAESEIRPLRANKAENYVVVRLRNSNFVFLIVKTFCLAAIAEKIYEAIDSTGKLASGGEI